MLITGNSRLKRSLKRATNYSEWLEAASAYDKYNGLDKWRDNDRTGQYDHISIRNRLGQLQNLKSRNDIKGLLYTLNEGIHGNMGGMGKAGLYGHAMSGTKHLVENYIEEIVDTLDILATTTTGEITEDEKLDFFRRASHCFGRSALMMSGSGSLLFFHVGVIRALAEVNLLPTVLSGSSGGAIVGSMVSTHSDEELTGLLRSEFFMDRIPEQSKAFGVVPIEELEAAVSQFIPDMTFQQAFAKTGRAMNVSIAPAETHQTSRLLNATTSPSVLIRSAVMASAAVPGIFPAVTLQALDSQGIQKAYLPSRKWVDGSVSDDLPAKRLARLYGVNHYVVSQTNPHVIPFVTDGHRKQSTTGILTEAGRRSAREWFNAVTLIADRAGKRGGALMQGTSLLRSIINQDYVGDINILPDYTIYNPLKLLTFPGEKQMKRLIDSGERCAWPKLEMIRQQTRISLKLDGILGQYTQL
ncbi:MAG: TAG lipase/steryl ester hydrolase/phospholipase A2/LPA acyltransferase [Halieaceae bacterium]|jgi:TAG lipase/steryl ester hydrolase/phospholipase A2/LPA acyltransferase